MEAKGSRLISLRIDALTHEFDGRVVLDSIDLGFEGSRLAVRGPNASGKSTLLRILAGLLTPSRGSASFEIDGRAAPREELRDIVGIAAPGVKLYDELTVRENLAFLADARGLRSKVDRISIAIDEMGLVNRADDLVGALSSGFAQRAQIAAALLHDPPVLLLDEPSSNLDEDGLQALQSVMRDRSRRGIVVIATNDPAEADWCEQELNLGAAA